MEKIVTLSCCGGKACPTIRIVDEDLVRIEDDFGGSARLSQKHIKELPKKLKELLSAIRKENKNKKPGGNFP